MFFPKVILEYQTLISVANIEANTGADAIAAAAQLIDSKNLLERHPRGYTPELPYGSLLSVEAATNPSAAAVYAPYADGFVPCTYEIDSDGDIKSFDVLPKALLSQITRDCAAILIKAIMDNDDAGIIKAAREVGKIYYTAGFINIPATPEEIEGGATPDANALYFENIDHTDSSSQSEIHSKIVELITSLPVFTESSEPDRQYKITSSVFVVPATAEAAESGINWQIEFGEIDIEYMGLKIGSVGTWRQFASSNIAYFDDQDDISVARSSLLEINGLTASYVEKPTIAGKLDAVIEF